MHCLTSPAGVRVCAAIFLGLLAAAARGATSTAESPVFTVDLTGTPLLGGFTKTGTEDTPISFAIYDFTSTYLDPESAGLASIRLESLPATGLLKLAGSPVATGQVIPRANIGQLTYEPAANDSGNRTFTVSASDGGLSSAPATVTLAITAVPDAPTLTAITPLTGANEDAAFSISYATLQTAADEADTDGDPISFRVEALSSGTLLKGGSAISPGQTLLGPGETLTWNPAANANGTLNAFTVRAWDGTSASATAVTVRVEVAPVNDNPTLSTVSPLAGATEDTPFTVNHAALLAASNAADADGDAVSFRIETVVAGTLTKGGAAITAGGTLLSPGESLVWTPAANANGTLAAFSVRAFDGGAASTNTVQVSVAVAAVNDLPVLGAVNPLSGATEDTAFTVFYAALAAAATMSDVETSAVSFRLETLSSGSLTKGGLAAVPGTTVLGPGEAWTWTPAANANGALGAFTVRAWDGSAASATVAAVTVNVAAVSDAPTLTAIGTLAGATEDTPFAVTHAALLAAADAADLEGDPISFRLEAISSGTVTKNGAAVTPGNTLLGSGETWLWTPAANASGTLNAFTVRAWDGTSASANLIQVKVTVAAANDAPTLTAFVVLSGASEDAAFTISHSALAAAGNAADPEGDQISFRVAAVSSGTLTKGGAAVVPGATLLAAGESLVWTPAENASGNLNAFTVMAWDGQAASVAAVQVVVAVAAVNDAPTLTAINPLAGATEDTAFTLAHATLAAAANAADTEGATLSFRIEAVLAGSLAKAGSPVAPGTTLLGPGETVVWTPPLNVHGALAAFSVRAWDGAAASASAIPVAIAVVPANDAPTLTAIAALTGASVDAPLSLSHARLLAAANAADADGDAISFRVEGVTAGSVIKGTAAAVPGTTLLRAGETWIWTPPAGLAGNLNAFTVRAWDGTAASAAPVAVQVVVADVRIVTQPRAQSVATGSPVTLSVTAAGTALTHQWYKAGTPIPGAVGPALVLVAFSAADAAIYHVTVTGSGVTLRSADAQLAPLPEGLVATHAVTGGGYVAGSTVTVTSSLAYPGTLTGLGWSVLLPTGWTFAGDGGAAGETKPTAGATELLEWAWTNIPASPVTFTFTVNVPAAESGDRSLTALVVARGLPGTSGAQQVLANPDPLPVPQFVYHDADTSRDSRIGLLELTRVIELFNTRNAAVRTGAYAVATTATEDGFLPEPARSGFAVVSLNRYHTADTNRDGKLSLLELTRVIELYNYRSGSNRTGQHRRQAGTEDGFEPGP